jgi:hypothetical protein
MLAKVDILMKREPGCTFYYILIAITLLTISSCASPSPVSSLVVATGVPPSSPAPAIFLPLLPTDDQFLDMVEMKTFDYFWNEVNPETGLIRDRSTPTSPCSIAAVGFGLSAIVVAQARGWISYEAAYRRILITLTTLDRLQQSNVVNLYSNHGLLYHFIDPNTGQRVWSSEISSIDTALLLAGVLHAGQHFDGTEIARLAEEIYARVDWVWILNGGTTLSHGWKPETGFLPYRWEGYSEAAILYLLAIGSPTHPIPVESWHAWAATFQRSSYKGPEIIYVSTGSLFAYQYPFIWVDLRTKRDAYMDYWQNAKRAVEANRRFVIDNMGVCRTYGENVWGLTASDGPDGYKGYGAKPGTGFHDCTIAPTGAGGSVALAPEIAIPALRFMYDHHGDRIWGPYGFRDAFNVDRDWWDQDYIGIDQGAMMLMIENHRSGLVWREFAAIPYVINAIRSVGLRE